MYVFNFTDYNINLYNVIHSFIFIVFISESLFFINLKFKTSKIHPNLLFFQSTRFISFIIFIVLFENIFWSFIKFGTVSYTNYKSFLHILWQKITYVVIEPIDIFFNFIIIILISVLFLSLINRRQKSLSKKDKMEFAIMIILIFLPFLFLILNKTLLTILVALETISLCSYVLVGYESSKKLSVYAGLRYLILGAFFGTFLILGIIFFYNNSSTLINYF